MIQPPKRKQNAHPCFRCCRRAAERDLPDGFGKGKLRGKFFKHQVAMTEQISAEFSVVTRETMIKKRVFRSERA